MQKHISHAKNTPTAHIFKHLIIEINSQHPHLLGFNSNLIPNSGISIISAVSLQGFQIFGTIREIRMYLSVPSWENPEYLGNSFDWIYFSYRIQQGLLLLSKYIEYSLDLGRTTRILRIIIKSSSEMAKIARPVQEISEFLEQSLYYCALIEKINIFLFVVIFSKLNAVKKNYINL